MKTNPPYPKQIYQSKLPTFSFHPLLLKFHAFTTFAKEGITYLSGQNHFLSCMQILQCQVKQITTPQRLIEVINPIKTITLYIYKKRHEKDSYFLLPGLYFNLLFSSLNSSFHFPFPHKNTNFWHRNFIGT